MLCSGWKLQNGNKSQDRLDEMLETIIHSIIQEREQTTSYKVIQFSSKVSKTKYETEQVWWDEMLSEVGVTMEMPAVMQHHGRWSSFWVAPPRLRSDTGVWSVRLNDNKSSSPAAGQEEEEVFCSCQNLLRQTHSRHVWHAPPPQSGLRSRQSIEAQEEPSDIWAAIRTEAITTYWKH